MHFSPIYDLIARCVTRPWAPNPPCEPPCVHLHGGPTGLEGTAELGDVFDCEEDLEMLSDDVIRTSAALDENGICVENVE
jgi:hypothetical protein